MTGNRNVQNHFGLTGKWLYISLMICNSSAMLLFGYDQGVFGGILTIESFAERFGLVKRETRKGIVVGSYDLGCLSGALLTVTIGDHIGRKRSIALGTTVMVAGAFLQTLAPSFEVMLVGRIIAGVGNGMNTATAPVWAVETSKTHFRGQSGMMLMVVNIVGLAISCWMTYACSFILSEASWRFPLGFQLFFALVIGLTVFWLPESPRWLLSRNEREKALSVMVALAGDGATAESAHVKAEFEEISKGIALEQSPQTGRKTMPFFRLLLGIGAQAMQQLTGINIICYYLPYVLTESVGKDPAIARLLAAVNAVTYFFSTLVGLFLIERWGRRRLLMLGALGQCCCWLAITALLNRAADAGKSIQEIALESESVAFAAEQSPQEKALGSGSVAFFFFFNIFFGAGWQGVSWLYPTEINSTQKRIQGMSFGVATNWLINFGVVFVTPIGIEKLGANFYIIWTVLNALIVPIIWLFYPETAARSLEDIDVMFEEHNTIWVGLNKAMTTRRPLPRVLHDPENVGVEELRPEEMVSFSPKPTIPSADSNDSALDTNYPANAQSSSDTGIRERHVQDTTGAAENRETDDGDGQTLGATLVKDATGEETQVTISRSSSTASTTALAAKSNPKFGFTSGPSS